MRTQLIASRKELEPPLFSICALEFIHLISSEANEICEQESKKTIAPDHIISALKVCVSFDTEQRVLKVPPQRLGFEEFTTEVEDVLKDHKKLVKVRGHSLVNIQTALLIPRPRTAKRRSQSSSNPG